jgi:hypothetical protein
VRSIGRSKSNQTEGMERLRARHLQEMHHVGPSLSDHLQLRARMSFHYLASTFLRAGVRTATHTKSFVRTATHTKSFRVLPSPPFNQAEQRATL